MKRLPFLLKSLLPVVLCLAHTVVIAQLNYNVHDLDAPVRQVQINMSAIDNGFDPEFEYLEAPFPSGEGYQAFLQQQKQLASERFPLRTDVPPSIRSAADEPEIVESFLGNNSTNGRPLDNHLAVSNGNQVVSVINFHMAIFNPDGSWIKGINFINLFYALDIDERIFDPRIIYDPVEDRWILVMMAGSRCDNSSFVFGFSQSNDAAGEWNFYIFDGCPNLDGSFADFPMMAITQDELFYTYNAVDDNESWQEGFIQTIILQINKHDGYAGTDLRTKVWENITYGGKSIRNLCPVKSATEELYTNCYFMSNRNFDIENDTFFVLEVTAPQDDPDVRLEIDVRQSDVPYGVPPNARQPEQMLQTNDARVLDAIRYGDWIQFVGNTIHVDNGNATIYHGYMEDISDLKDIHLYVLEHFDSETGVIDLGYPGIAFTGQSPSDRDVIIIASHSNDVHFPGNSACYAGQDESHSPWVTLKEGDSHIDMIQDFDLERWGDYAGAQRKYDEPGVVWVSASFGQQGKRNNTWVSALQPAGNASSVSNVRADRYEATAFPNPAADRVSVRFTLPELAVVKATVFDVNGVPAGHVLQTTPRYTGEMVLHFSTASLVPGTYVIRIEADGRHLFSKRFVVQ